MYFLIRSLRRKYTFYINRKIPHIWKWCLIPTCSFFGISNIYFRNPSTSHKILKNVFWGIVISCINTSLVRLKSSTRRDEYIHCEYNGFLMYISSSIIVFRSTETSQQPIPFDTSLPSIAKTTQPIMKIFKVVVFTQPLHQEQNVTRKQFLIVVQWVWIQNPSTHRLIALARLKGTVCPITYLCLSRILRYILLSMVSTLCEIQIWIPFAAPVSWDDNRYPKLQIFPKDYILYIRFTR